MQGTPGGRNRLRRIQYGKWGAGGAPGTGIPRGSYPKDKVPRDTARYPVDPSGCNFPRSGDSTPNQLRLPTMLRAKRGHALITPPGRCQSLRPCHFEHPGARARAQVALKGPGREREAGQDGRSPAGRGCRRDGGGEPGLGETKASLRRRGRRGPGVVQGKGGK